MLEIGSIAGGAGVGSWGTMRLGMLGVDSGLGGPGIGYCC